MTISPDKTRSARGREGKTVSDGVFEVLGFEHVVHRGRDVLVACAEHDLERARRLGSPSM